MESQVGSRDYRADDYRGAFHVKGNTWKYENTDYTINYPITDKILKNWSCTFDLRVAGLKQKRTIA